MTKTVKAAQLKTESKARVVIRDGAGHKLFEIDIHGVSIAVTTPLGTEIAVFDPNSGTCQTIDDLSRTLSEHIAKMSPKEKALLRIQLRKEFKLPPQAEPDVWRQ